MSGGSSSLPERPDLRLLDQGKVRFLVLVLVLVLVREDHAAGQEVEAIGPGPHCRLCTAGPVPKALPQAGRMRLDVVGELLHHACLPENSRTGSPATSRANRSTRA